MAALPVLPQAPKHLRPLSPTWNKGTGNVLLLRWGSVGVVERNFFKEAKAKELLLRRERRNDFYVFFLKIVYCYFWIHTDQKSNQFEIDELQWLMETSRWVIGRVVCEISGGAALRSKLINSVKISFELFDIFASSNKLQI